MSVAAPRFHQQDFPDVLEVEQDAFDPSVIAALQSMGHKVKVSARDPVPGRIGRVHAVGALARGRVEAVADLRREGAGLVLRPGSR